MKFRALKERPVILILLLATLIYALSLNSKLTLGGDDASYIMLGEALIKGRGYTDFYGPVEKPNAIFPFVFPLILAPLVGIFGRNVLILKLVPLLSTILALYILFLLLKEYVHKRYLLPVMILTAISPLALNYSTTLLADALYLSISFTTLLLLGKYKKQSSLLNKYLFLTVLAMLLSHYTRFIGIALFAGGVLYLGFKKDIKKTLAVSVLFIPLLLPWIYRSHLVGNYSWAARFLVKDVCSPEAGTINILDFIKCFFYNIVIYVGKVFPEAFFYPHLASISRGHPIFILKLMLGGFVSFLSLYGFIIHIRKKINTVSLYLIPYFGLCLAYPWHTTRFLLPILPFSFYYFILGAESAIERTNLIFSKGFNPKKIAVFFISMIIFSSLIGDAVLIFKARGDPYSPRESNYIHANEWIKKNTPAESIIMCRKPLFTYFYTKRKSTYYPQTTDVRKVIRSMEENGIDYVIIDTLTGGAERYLKPAIAEYPEKFTLLYSASRPETKIYEVLRQ